MSDPFKFFSLEKLQSLRSPIVGIITEGLVQSIAEEDCGGRLTDQELAEFNFVTQEWCWDQLFELIYQANHVCRTSAEHVKQTDDQIDELVAQDKSDSEIAGALGVSETCLAP